MSRRAPIGFALGVVLGLGDGLLLELLGLEMVLDEYLVTWPVMGFFALSFGGLGFAIGRLMDARDELRAQQSQLVEAEKLASLGRMAAGVAHEVRNPLGVIRSSAELLAESLEREEEVEACSFIVEEVDRLDRFVGEILDLSRPAPRSEGELGQEELVERALSLSGSALEVEQELGTQPLPEAWDRVLLGLLRNAEQSGATRVQLRGGPGWLELADDGPGVPEELQAQVFEPFFTTRAQGTGLGLAMARKLVEAQGGSIRLLDRGLDGRGVTFRLEQA